MGDDELDSIRGFAKRVGRSHPTIIQAIDDGRIKAVKRDQGTGKVLGIYWRQAVGEYAGNTDPTQAERTGAAPLNIPPASSSDPAQAAMPPAAGGAREGEDLFHGKPAGETGATAPGEETSKSGKEDPHDYLEHRSRTEEFKSKKAELEYLKDLGQLVPAVESREANFRRYRMLRDKLLNIPDRVATILAAERDPSRVHLQLTEEIKRVLSELSIDATAEAAGGAAERVAA